MGTENAIPLEKEGAREQNDKLILSALETLRDPTKRAKLKLKCTVPAVCKLTKLSTNTIRSRSWAVAALKDMKAAAKRKATEVEAGETVPPAVSLVDALRGRVALLLEQNSLLFDEILLLREQVKARELRIEELQGKRLAAI
ncbi:hypothetical protein [Paracidovorax konjaci]|uniref:Uncharacterized protein n=1 Tax=Paracidovorax konjaci TaxID=32040 RepID=A0A1I1X0Y7_9BURK|nr:hypothetical protein [Paracidovorax konjaci]SFE01046.1 hypothetical protein SAMN04489710_111144 [Paracidovorax konjaci]